MYQLVSAMGKLRTIGARWEDIEIGEMVVATLFSQYEKVYAVLTNPFFPNQMCLDLDEIKGANGSSEMTFNAWLASIGNASLPTTTNIPKVETKYAIYSDAFRARFTVRPINPNVHPDVDLPRAEKKWVDLRKDGIDYQLLYRSCLASVNGLFHLTDTDGERLMVVDAQATSDHSGRAELGLYSFRELGSLEFLPIKPEMIHHRYADQPYKTYLYIDTGTPRPNKTAMLVLGGYLHVLDDKVFSRINDSIFAICFDNFPLRDRYFESVGIIDLSSLGLEHDPDNPAKIKDQQLHSDEVLVKYATLSQSFIVFVDNTHLFVEYEDVQPTKIANIYVSFTEPKYPLVTGIGKISDYWRVKEHGQYALTVVNGVRNFYNFNTTTDDQLDCIDDAAPPFKPSEYTRPKFLKVGSDLFFTTGS